MTIRIRPAATVAAGVLMMLGFLCAAGNGAAQTPWRAQYFPNVEQVSDVIAYLGR
jgi:hypothetical protein